MRAFLALLLILLTATVAAAQDQPTESDIIQMVNSMTPQQAREFVNEIVDQSDAYISRQINDNSAINPNTQIAVENNTLIYRFEFPGLHAISDDMVRFLLACNNSGAKIDPSVDMILTLLDKAGFNIGCYLIGSDTSYIELPPSEYKMLLTTPPDKLAFNRSALLTEFIEVIDNYAQQAADEEVFESYFATISGQYLTFRGTTHTVREMLSNNSLNPQIKQYITGLMFSSMSAESLNQFAKVAKELKLAGIKIDISDPDGNQRVLTLSWDELNSLGSNPTRQSEAEFQLDLADKHLSSSIKNDHGLDVRFSHLTTPPTLSFTITYNYPDTQFVSILANTSEETVLDTYRPLLKVVLPLMPEISNIRFILTNGSYLTRVNEYPASNFQ